MTAIDSLLDHVLETGYGDLPPAAVQAALTFIYDSVGVGLSGARHPRSAQVLAAARAWGSGNDAQVWASGERLPAQAAALVNAYQVHNQEFDCVHEDAVVHPMAVILPSLLAWAERQGAVSGRELILAVTLAVDVAAFVGMAQGAPMRFFRPAMCGALGATAGLARLAGASRAVLHNALGIAYSQLSGTMQAHVEGSPMLALQVGMNARAAVSALDLALQGFEGPKDILEGPFGYFALFDGQADWARASAELGRTFQITRVSHKPFPTGRAAHGALDALATLQDQGAFSPSEVTRVLLRAPPLVARLVGRPPLPSMDANYARLCLPYLAAVALLDGGVGLDAVDPARIGAADWQALAARVAVEPWALDQPNALAPQRLELALADGRMLALDLPQVLGHPERPLPRAAQHAKFAACCRSAGFDAAASAGLEAALSGLEGLADVRSLAALLAAPH
ncbi:MmgE/PrpD family protein [Massilia oculi]|uniref:MmgE/PrpD family protein n=1 Tax=Massilia hydrophila TaxID=3044279 RepID=A0ABS7YDA8_9BURK|nr:MmgE/PrpD family protein [Massilia oculi]MCA1857353.1 MmgE/PrpD family protein [Massilia oculi]